MAQMAPERPTLVELEGEHRLLTTVEMDRLKDARLAVGQTILTQSGLVAIVGPCAMTLDRDTIDREGRALRALQEANEGLVTLHRLPPWKPRTSPTAWHGLETDPETVRAAYATIVERGRKSANVAIEIGHNYHLSRYAAFLSMMWIGSRHVDHETLIGHAALYGRMPLGIKNGMSGEIDTALDQVYMANDVRRGYYTTHKGEPERAPAVLIYRGGTNVRTPQQWEDGYREALERTNGWVIVDVAHGGEMAHDPDGNFEKSVIGQIACMNHVILVAQKYGEVPVGISIEASDAESPTDFVMPFNRAIEGVRELHALKVPTPAVVQV